ncbi:hypothetical protein A4A49_34078 [Nicotiana attenuata]|uniref:Uncharacterized protein n=1 Tax=Nicotiana attenuata TaxID=49451 RepID=A0A1J6KPD1_NICAT|nr:hypothetical protein A4A49_34078 [Nicotiana attenuata]
MTSTLRTNTLLTRLMGKCTMKNTSEMVAENKFFMMSLRMLLYSKADVKGDEEDNRDWIVKIKFDRGSGNAACSSHSQSGLIDYASKAFQSVPLCTIYSHRLPHSGVGIPNFYEDELDFILLQDSCVAFAISDAVSAKLAIQTPEALRGDAISFSKQEVVECLPIEPYGTTFLKVYNYIRRWGLNFENYYRCRSLVLRRQGLCKAFIQDWDWLESYEVALALEYQALTATMVHYPTFANRGYSMDVYDPLPYEAPTFNDDGCIALHAVLVLVLASREVLEAEPAEFCQT